MTDRTRLYRNIVIAGIIASTAILYAIELKTSQPVFSITNFSLNYAVSFTFILLSLIANYGIAMLMNRTVFRFRNVMAIITAEVISAIAVAPILVIVCNLPYIEDMAAYIATPYFVKSAIAAALVNIFILAGIEYMTQTIRSRTLQNEIAAQQYRQLKSQINPHFLFNSLNVLVSLINKNQESAVTYTKKLSAVYRYVLIQDTRDTVTVREELDFIDNYIAILKTRFDKGLTFAFDIKDDDMRKSVPPMSLQLLIENAIKHNAVLPDDPLVINISSDGAMLCVTNNLRPRTSCSEGTGIGLINLSKKYAILAETDITILMNDDTFVVKLPLL